jgi:hypothetical protein
MLDASFDSSRPEFLFSEGKPTMQNKTDAPAKSAMVNEIKTPVEGEGPTETPATVTLPEERGGIRIRTQIRAGATSYNKAT